LGSGAGAGGVSGGGDGHAGGSAQVARAGNGAGSGNGAGPGGRNGEQLLRTIRRQIERVWTYPDAARRDGLEGTVWLRFRIGPDGSVEQVEVDRSSGHALLDDAAITAVRRAGPYPSYGGPIRYPFTYRLDR
jgi:protein TonB